MEVNTISRERLVQAGIEELKAHGAGGFSLRRVAQRCGVSCAAPYRHFRDRRALLRAIAMQYNDAWHAREREVIGAADSDLTAALRQILKAYLRFLMENPAYCVLATQMDADSSRWHLHTLLEGASPTRALLQEYGRAHCISPEAAALKVSLLRAQLFGITMMVGAGELRLDEENMHLIYIELNSAFLS